MKSLSIIIPAFNESKRIQFALKTIVQYLENRFDYEIIVIDDGSTDNTFDSVMEIIKNNQKIKYLKNEKNYGKGFSIKKGMLCAKKEYLLFSDADLSTPIEEVEKLIKYLEEGYDIAIGSRSLKDSEILIKQPFYRRIIGKTFNLLVKFFGLAEFNDTQCGFKLFKKEVALEIFKKVKIDHFAFDVEVLYLAKKKGYSIKEVPVQWKNSPASRIKPLLDSLKMFIDLIKIRFIYKYE